mmetsp:Transcript_8274/g.22715  ORF Transcript_8274/g.22715 Transcript_8274/m.22715 type:complete len:204 (+) Transcript_8274:75-686(+)
MSMHRMKNHLDLIRCVVTTHPAMVRNDDLLPNVHVEITLIVPPFPFILVSSSSSRLVSPLLLRVRLFIVSDRVFFLKTIVQWLSGDAPQVSQLLRHGFGIATFSLKYAHTDNWQSRNGLRGPGIIVCQSNNILHDRFGGYFFRSLVEFVVRPCYLLRDSLIHILIVAMFVIGHSFFFLYNGKALAIIFPEISPQFHSCVGSRG